MKVLTNGSSSAIICFVKAGQLRRINRALECGATSGPERVRDHQTSSLSGRRWPHSQGFGNFLRTPRDSGGLAWGARSMKHRPANDQRGADPAKMNRPEQGMHERDGQKRAGRGNSSRLELGMQGTEDGLHVERKTPGHPVAPIVERISANKETT